MDEKKPLPIQININGGGFLDDLKTEFIDAFNLNPQNQNNQPPDPEKQKQLTDYLTLQSKIGEEQRKRVDERNLEKQKSEYELKSQVSQQKFMKDMMDKMNKNDNKELTKKINENLPLILSEVQQIRDYLEKIDGSLRESKVSQIKEKIDKDIENDNVILMRKKLKQRDRMIINNFNDRKNELLKMFN